MQAVRSPAMWVSARPFFLNNKLRLRAAQLAGSDFYGNQEYGSSWLIEPMGYGFGKLYSSTYESFNPAGTPGAEVRFAPSRTFYQDGGDGWKPQSVSARS